LEDFIQALRARVSPHKHPIDAEWMPWEMAGKMSDDQLTAMLLYLQSMPAKVSGDG
jgi:hypothetical protein